MIRHFCDICGREIYNDQKGLIRIKGNRAYTKILCDYAQDEICSECINNVMTLIEATRKEKKHHV